MLLVCIFIAAIYEIRYYCNNNVFLLADVCVCVYVCVYAYVCVYTYVCLRVYVCVHI